MAFTFNRSEPGFWLSGAAHVALLTIGVVSFASAKLPDAQEGIPVEIVTDTEVSQITNGEITASQVRPEPKPRVERQAETRVERDPGEAKQDVPSPPKRPVEAKVDDDDAPPPPVPPKRPEVAAVEPPSRPDPKAEAAARAEAAVKADAQKRADAAARAEAAAKAERAAAEEKAQAEKAEAEAKARRLAEAESKEKAEAEAKAKAEADAKAKAERRRKLAEAKAKREKAEAEAKARRQAEQAEQFNPSEIAKMLASKEPAQSSGSTGREVQRTASLGTAVGTAARLNPSQRDQIAGLIREQLIRCWQPPIAVQSAPKPPTATVRLGLREDGSLATAPALMNNSSDPLFRTVADSALRATRRCAPLRIPPRFAPYYQDWKDLVVDFDPREMG